MLETCEVIAEQLLSKYVRVPNDTCLREIVDGFCLKLGLPQTVGALDGTHESILKPVDSASDYYNRKGLFCTDAGTRRFSWTLYECKHWLARNGA